MSRIIVCGGGAVGLSAAIMLAADGHEVTVLESDPAEPPEPASAWADWDRRGVSQFRQPHNLFARFRHVCDAELPGLTDELAKAGCTWVNFLDTLPPSLGDTAPRPGDEACGSYTGRRPVVESVIAAAARRQPGLQVRRGTKVAGLLSGPRDIAGVVHVSGVRTATGEELPADLVVDATGRRSPALSWLAEAGAQLPPEAAEDSGFVYYSRYFSGPSQPRLRGPGLLPLGSISLLTLAADNNTWSVTVFGRSGDAALKGLRDPEAFTRVVRACPLQEHWLDGTPLTGMLAMAGVLDRIRTFAPGGQPAVSGFAAVGDAWASTNPSAGRGLSIGLLHAQVLRAAARATLGSPAAFARTFAEATAREVEPYVREQIRRDQTRLAQMERAADGAARPPGRRLSLQARFAATMPYDPELFRAFTEAVSCLALEEDVLARPGIRDRIERLADVEPRPAPGPGRAELLQLIAG